jgi:nucleoside-diphosphate-sugar epimerase
MRFLITGASGWLGSLVASILAERGHRLVCLVRGDAGHTRLCDLLGPAALPAATMVEGDDTRQRAGVSDADLGALRGTVDGVLHFAATLRLDDGADDELQRTNVEGTRHALALADALGGPRGSRARPVFAHVSSCSVAGDAPSFAEHDLDIGQRFRNAYERTKLAGERLVAAWPGRSMVLRVPGVLGDWQTGRSRFFAGTFYRLVAAYTLLREEVLAACRRGAASELARDGVRFAADGVLHLPAHVAFAPQADCAVVPQDWLARTLADLAADPAAAGTFHLVHPAPPTVGWAIDTALRHLLIAPPAALRPLPAAGPCARFAARSLARLTRHHTPYLQSVPRLSCERLPAVLGSRYVRAPDLDAAYLRRVIDCAVEARFGEGS